MSKIKTAVILAAGKGSRLDRPDLPKPLVRIGHKPLILWTIERLQQAGIKKIFIVVGFKGDDIKKELIGNKTIRVALEFIEQRDVSGKGMLQSILSLTGKIHEPFILTVTDFISEKDPYRVRRLSLDSEGVWSVIGTDPVYYAYAGANSKVEIEDGRIVRVGRRLTQYGGFECGVYICGARTLERFRALIKKYPSIKTVEELFNAFLKRFAFRPFELAGEWFDVNTPATMVRAELFLRKTTYGVVGGEKKEKKSFEPLESPHVSFQRTKEMQSEVYIRRGIIHDIGRHEIIPASYIHSPHFLLTDATVDPLYGTHVAEKLRRVGFSIHKLVMSAGEGAKSFETYTNLAEQIFAYGLDEGSILLDIGGGVVNNMAGTLAATLYRGIKLIHLPTTTMAQFDAAIDFKQAINHSKGKNLIGAYHPAFRIVIDPDVLKTLPERHIRNGLAESLKHAITQDQHFFDYFINYNGRVDDSIFLEDVARRTVALKVPLLSGDTKDEHNEMAPQYGHCIGHAIEHLSGYELLHGEAVAIGACVTAEVARLLGIADDATVDAHYRLFEKYHLPIVVPASMSMEDITNTIRYDKHYLGKLPRLGLLETIGTMWHDRGTYAIPIDYAIIERAVERNKKRGKH